MSAGATVEQAGGPPSVPPVSPGAGAHRTSADNRASPGWPGSSQPAGLGGRTAWASSRSGLSAAASPGATLLADPRLTAAWKRALDVARGRLGPSWLSRMSRGALKLALPTRGWEQELLLAAQVEFEVRPELLETRLQAAQLRAIVAVSADNGVEQSPDSRERLPQSLVVAHHDVRARGSSAVASRTALCPIELTRPQAPVSALPARRARPCTAPQASIRARAPADRSGPRRRPSRAAPPAGER